MVRHDTTSIAFNEFCEVLGMMPFESLVYEGTIAKRTPKMSRYFEKVSRGQWTKDYSKWYEDTKMVDSSPKDVIEDMDKVYENLKKPKRATIGSAGYDIYTPFNVVLQPNEKKKIPTGYKAHMNSDEAVIGLVRSSDGSKRDIRTANVFPLIDSDYVNADTEGMIYIILKNEGNVVQEFKAGDPIAQLMFVKYLVTDDDDMKETRTGGIGSTTK